MGWELYFVAATAVVALIFASILAKRITAADAGDELMQSIALSIQEGASSFLKREYTVLAGFVAIVAAILLIFIDLDVAGKYEGTYQLARLDSLLCANRVYWNEDCSTCKCTNCCTSKRRIE